MGGAVIRVFAMVCMFLCFTSVALAAVGKAVFHDKYTPSACYGNQNKGNMIAGVSSALWDGKAACGRRYRVTCIGPANLAARACRQGSVDVTVVDYCFQCKGEINLSLDAFSRIADPNAGIVRVRYDRI